jgi:DNA-binding SARP family transcriptional activator
LIGEPSKILEPTPRPELRMRCFGPFELGMGERRVQRSEFRRRQALTLLRLLVLRGGTAVDRSVLSETLWPGVDESAGANRLHGVIHALRSAIEPDLPSGWLFIKSDGELYWFDLGSPHWVDLYAFRSLLSSAASAEREGRASSAIADLEGALALYRGDLFADAQDTSLFEGYRVQERERCIGACKRLSALLAAEGEHEEAARCLRRALELDRLREDVHVQLMERLQAAGRRQDALAHYQVCVQTLREELDAAPLPTTVELGRRIRAALNFGGPESGR